ncbi:complement C1q tumor necrosis factor-related protein 3-like isoform X1 [Mya arenaria]|uniref:complement C1q tumor necrosis factor-related protein 3-like isoform X1 n=1 Tax=Mya arenaria TaxID=6604 RepID=UPI0022E7C7B4|nr:complement C1q tumor necrosis factor-related protein 3-like isoform X1 [Mya arenaria]
MLFGGAVVVCALGFHVIFAGEPNCLSRFDYDEKMLLKLLRIEDKLVHIETFIQDLKETDQQLQMKMNVLQKNMATTAEHSNKTETLLNDNISITNASMSLLQTQMKAVTSPPIAFLVRNPTYESGKVIFSSELLNEGNAFTPGTGEFLAQLSGLYYFSFHLLATSSTKYMYCSFYKNGNNLDVYAHADGSTSSNDSGSMSAFITLKKGDVFHVGGCAGSPSVSFSGWSTLTGALIKLVYV